MTSVLLTIFWAVTGQFGKYTSIQAVIGCFFGTHAQHESPSVWCPLTKMLEMTFKGSNFSELKMSLYWKIVCLLLPSMKAWKNGKDTGILLKRLLGTCSWTLL